MPPRRRGSKPADLGSMRALFEDGRVWSAVGVVRARERSKHYLFDDDDVLIDVDLGHEAVPVWCRLAGFAGGESMGIWRVPPEGTEVAVLIPQGDMACDPMIVGILSSGGIPALLKDGDDVDPDVLVIVNSKKVKIKSTDDDITLNDGDKCVARALDTLDVGSLAGVAGPFPVTFTYIPKTKVGDNAVPGAPSVGATVNITGVIDKNTGAPKVKA